MLNLVKKLSLFSWAINKLHSNILLLIGGYGLLVILFIMISMDWLFQTDFHTTYVPSLPPAWWHHGDINHLLGTDKKGHDIFLYLLISYRTTISMALQSTSYIIIAAAVINYVLFFIPATRFILLVLFRLLNTIPTILGVILIYMLLGDNLTNMLIAVSLTHLPRFIHHIHQEMLKENKKTYITAYRLDGLSEFKLVNHCIIPNIMPTYLTEVAILLGRNMLVITTLNFLGFNRNTAHPDLGMMLFEMKETLMSNYWAFLSPGLLITITLTFVYLINIGLNSDKGRV